MALASTSGSPLPIQAAVTVEQDGINADHDEIQHVQIQHNIIAVQNLIDDAADIAKENGPQENRAAAGSGAALQGLIDIAGPGKSEANQHTDLKNTHKHDLLSIYIVQGE